MDVTDDADYILDINTGIKYNRQRNEIYSRIVGYYRPISQWNDGKLIEFNERKNFTI